MCERPHQTNRHHRTPVEPFVRGYAGWESARFDARRSTRPQRCMARAIDSRGSPTIAFLCAAVAKPRQVGATARDFSTGTPPVQRAGAGRCVVGCESRRANCCGHDRLGVCQRLRWVRAAVCYRRGGGPLGIECGVSCRPQCRGWRTFSGFQQAVPRCGSLTGCGCLRCGCRLNG